MNRTAGLVQLSFSGVPFPYKEIRIDGELRDHTHEYPHTDGGANEKLGRRLYAFSIETVFLADTLLPQYKDLWPHNLNKLVALFDAGMTGALVLPQIGIPLDSYCTNWTRILRSSMTNGESVTLKFKEDITYLRTLAAALEMKTLGFSTTFAELEKKVSSKGLLDKLSEGLDRILRVGSDILAYKDQFDMYSNLLEAKLLSLTGLCSQFIGTAKSAKDIDNWDLVDALHSFAYEANLLLKDMKEQGLTTRIYTVRTESTLSQLSYSIYGVSVRGQDLMALNKISDPFAIPAGTKIRYYPD